MIKKAFTMAEVLITLGLIGVLALAAVPTLNKNSEQKFAKDFERVYQNLNSNVFYYKPVYKNKQIVAYKLELDNIDKCTKNCFANKYKTISGKNYPIKFNNTKKGILLYGERVAINKHGNIYVDLNGPKGPNTKCRDLFEFEFYNQNFYPVIYPANTHIDFDIKDAFYIPLYNSDTNKKAKEFKLSNVLSNHSDEELQSFIHTEGKYCELKIVSDNFVIKY